LGLKDAPPTPEEISLGGKKASYEGAMDIFDKDAYAIELGKGQDAADEYLRNIGIPEEKIPYFESIVDIEGSLELAQEGKDLSEESITLSETQAETQYGTEGEAYRTAGVQYGLGMKQAGLVAGRSLFGIKQQADVATVKGGFATQGSVAGAVKRTQKGIFQDYTMQQKRLAEARTGVETRADISYGGVMGYGTAAVGIEGEEGYIPASEDYQAGSADIARREANLTYKQKKFTLGQQAADEWWDTYDTSGY
jgi:hypothetical protein